jgi:hypothetical protein
LLGFFFFGISQSVICGFLPWEESDDEDGKED